MSAIRRKSAVDNHSVTDRSCKSYLHPFGIAKDNNITPELKKILNMLNTPGISEHSYNQNRDSFEKIYVNKMRCQNEYPEVLSQFRHQLGTMDGNRIKYLMSTQKIESYDNFDIHKNIECITDAILYTDNEYNDRNRLRIWIEIGKMFATASEAGVAFPASFAASTIYVIKTPKNHDPSLLHELFIGFYALNPLKKYVPNFMYVYGSIPCAFIRANKGPISSRNVCDKNGVYDYLITENLEGTVSYNTWLNEKTTTSEEIQNVFVQILNALHLAWLYTKYTHYDLHGGNILIKKLDKPISIPYYLDLTKKNLYLTTKIVAYIIDYGLSSTTISHIPLGVKGYEKSGVQSISNPIADIRKLLNVTQFHMHNNIYATVRGKNIVNSFDAVLNVNPELIIKLDKYDKEYDHSFFIIHHLKHKGVTQYDFITEGVPMGTFAYYLAVNTSTKEPNNTTRVNNCTFYDIVANKNQKFKNSGEICDSIFAINQSGGTKAEKMKWLSSVKERVNVNYIFDAEIKILRSNGSNNTHSLLYKSLECMLKMLSTNPKHITELRKYIPK